ncbi:unnamed protein product [Spodoptera exigua]|nr:unnamed protein product [Spodoptera exigua]
MGGAAAARVRRGRARCGMRTGVVGSGRRRRGGRRGRAVRGVRAAVQQRVQPAAARAPDPRGAAGGVRHVRPLLQDAAVPAPPHAGAAPARAPAPQAAAAAPRAAARPALPAVAALSLAPAARRRRPPVTDLRRYDAAPAITVARLFISGHVYRALRVELFPPTKPFYSIPLL